MAHLLSMFQELKHYQSELTRNNEQEVFQLLEICEELRRRWQASAQELVSMKRMLTTYETDMGQVRLENKELRGQLVEARSQIAGLVTAREELERERGVLSSQIEMVRDLLRDDVNMLPEYSRKKLQFLNDRPTTTIVPRNQSRSVLTEGEIDYDRTEDSLDAAEADRDRGTRQDNFGGGIKRSISLTRLVPTAPGIEDDVEPNRRKRSRDDVEIPNANVNYLRPMVEYRADGFGSPLNRSFSEPNNIGGLQPQGGPRSMKSVADLATLSPITAATTGRRHAFLSKTSLKTEYCDHCEKRFNFAGTFWKCEVCKLQCHAECRQFALLPCIARGTPATKSRGGKLLDFVPRDPPMVPNVIVHCINEIERRGLTSLGLYRVPGSEGQVVDLLDKFLFGRGVPNLHQVGDISVLAGCIKKFLHQLSEPVIPISSWTEFVTAGVKMTQEGMQQEATVDLQRAVAELPQPNRDTLAFLIIHLQKVADYSNDNKMTISNLAKVFGPSIVGMNTSAVDLRLVEQASPKLEATMTALLGLSPEYYGHFLAMSESAPLIGSAPPLPNSATTGTWSNRKPQLGTSMLGPVGPGIMGTPKTAPGYRPRNHKQKFFNPPWK